MWIQYVAGVLIFWTGLVLAESEHALWGGGASVLGLLLMVINPRDGASGDGGIRLWIGGSDAGDDDGDSDGGDGDGGDGD